MSRPSMAKRNRELAKKTKAEAKRARRQASDAEPGDEFTDAADAAAEPEDEVSTSELLRMIEEVHRLRDAGEMSEDDFEQTKADLLGRIRVD